MTLTQIKTLLPYPDFTIRQLAILLLLHRAETKRVKDLAIALCINKPSVSRAFDGLCRLKLIKRIREEDDARQVYGELTDLGQELIKKIS